MLSRDCDGCSGMEKCKLYYFALRKGDKVFCPDGTIHLIDE